MWISWTAFLHALRASVRLFRWTVKGYNFPEAFLSVKTVSLYHCHLAIHENQQDNMFLSRAALEFLVLEV